MRTRTTWEFMAFAGIADPGQFRQLGRGHALAWRRDLELRRNPKGKPLAGATIRRKLSALSGLFDALCEANAVSGNPVDGVKRLKVATQEGSTPTIADYQARALLAASDLSTLRGLRDRAMLATFLYHGLRRAELCTLHLADLQDRRGVRHLRVLGMGSKMRYVPPHPVAAGDIAANLEAAGHGDNMSAPLFMSTSNNARGCAITPKGVYSVLARYAAKLGIDIDGLGRMRCARPRSRTHWRTTLTWRKSWTRSATPISRQRACTTAAARVLRTVRHSRSFISD